MQRQACEPCAKRKVRCDRQEPCLNCKRRKTDYCVYPEVSQEDKIKKLEQIIRSLGGDPNKDRGDSTSHRVSTASNDSPGVQSPYQTLNSAGAIHTRSKDPIIVEEEDGQQSYLESRTWLVHGHRETGDRFAKARNPFLLQSAPDAFHDIIASKQPHRSLLSEVSPENARFLWNVFRRSIAPIITVVFSWELNHLESLALAEPPTKLDDAQIALVCSIYLISAVSISASDCEKRFLEPKGTLQHKYRVSCEEALAKTNILCMKTTTTLKAMAIYLMACLDRVSTQSLWSLMGVAIRNAEKLGIHRDGTLLGFSPAETESRRRLWWHLQYLDLILAVRLGVTPLTLMASWDVKPPLNIEDNDLMPGMTIFPEERKGLTSTAYSMFTFYVLDQQRRYHADKGQFELSWSTNQSVSKHTKESFIDVLEGGLNATFIQYCDPIKPVHVLLQIMSRSLICLFRQRVLLTATTAGHVDLSVRTPLLALSMQMLEYTIVFHSHPALKDFEWLTSNGFPWPAFMVVLVETSRENDTNKCELVWELLSKLYEACTSLLDLVADRRRLYAAELITSAWKACESKGMIGQLFAKPSFVTTLESRLVQCTTASVLMSVGSDTQANSTKGQSQATYLSNSVAEEGDAEAFDLDFQDIDWSFWNSID